jgi:4-hydroxyphenylpyruvate dioxygenase
MPADLHLAGYDAIEFWVGNAKQAAHYYHTAFGFDLVAYAGPETGVRDRASYVLEQDAIRFVVTSGLRSDDAIVAFQARHGDAIRDVAFRVPDAEEAFGLAVERGATPHREPTVLEDDHGKLVIAAIAVYGETIHSFVERDAYAGAYLPGYEPLDEPSRHPANQRLRHPHSRTLLTLETAVLHQLSGHDEIVASQVRYPRLEVQEIAHVYQGSAETVSVQKR